MEPRQELLAAAAELSACGEILTTCGDAQDYRETLGRVEAALKTLRSL